MIPKQHTLSRLLPSSRRPVLRAGLLLTTVAVLLAAASTLALATDGTGVGALLDASFRAEAKGDNTKALRSIKQVINKRPDHYVANLRGGWLAYQAQRYDESIRFYKKAVALMPKAVEPKLGLMLPLMAKKRWREAEQAGASVLKAAPRNYLASSRLAWIYFSQGRFARAERLYRQVIDDYPSDMDMMLGLAWTWQRMGKRRQAAGMFEAVLAIRPKNASATQGLTALK